MSLSIIYCDVIQYPKIALFQSELGTWLIPIMMIYLTSYPAKGQPLSLFVRLIWFDVNGGSWGFRPSTAGCNISKKSEAAYKG